MQAYSIFLPKSSYVVSSNCTLHPSQKSGSVIVSFSAEHVLESTLNDSLDKSSDALEEIDFP